MSGSAGILDDLMITVRSEVSKRTSLLERRLEEATEEEKRLCNRVNELEEECSSLGSKNLVISALLRGESVFCSAGGRRLLVDMDDLSSRAGQDEAGRETARRRVC